MKFWTKPCAMCGTKDAAQGFDVASENAMTAIRHETGNFVFFFSIRAQSTCLRHETALWCQGREHSDQWKVACRTEVGRGSWNSRAQLREVYRFWCAPLDPRSMWLHVPSVLKRWP